VPVTRLFVYGTLADDDLVERLVGRRLPWRPAVLEGYCRTLDPKIGYPVVHPLAGSTVDGRLLDGLDEDALRALDAYEGTRYRRVVVRVETPEGRADTYMYVPVPPRPSGGAEGRGADPG
jgi:gamma-glutamylcyclotransferase (GGCT)/AIG2-like uncharacterized protein YtfP